MRKTGILAAAALTLTAGVATAAFAPALAFAQDTWSARTAPAEARQDYAGRTVRDSDGVVLGKIERVVLGADGAAKQVLVRPDGLKSPGYRVLPVSGLKPQGDDLGAPLTKAEFDSLPLVDPPAPRPRA